MITDKFTYIEKKTTSGIYLENLTGIRALAVIWVLIAHTWGITGGKVEVSILLLNATIGFTNVIRMGEWGVDIFFVLSGFLLTLHFLKNSASEISWIDTKRFYCRRILRILPVYYLVIFSLIIFSMFGFSKVPTATEIIQHSFFINPLFGTPPLRGAFWSLPVEALFYLFLPALLWLSLRLKSFHIIFIFLIISTIAFRVFVINSDHIQSKGSYLFSFFGRMDQFSVGAICANLCLNRPASPREGNIITVLGLVSMIIFSLFIAKRGDMFSSKDYFYYFFQTIVALLVAKIIYGAASRSTIAHLIFGNGFMILVGTISYSIYLWHTVILDVYALNQPIFGTSRTSNFYTTLLYTLPPIASISYLSYAFVEHYFLKIRHKSENRSQSFIENHPIFFLGIVSLLLIFTAGIASSLIQPR